MIRISPNFYTSFEIIGFFRDFAIFLFFSTFFIVIGNRSSLRPWSSWTANSDKKYMEVKNAFTLANKTPANKRSK